MSKELFFGIDPSDYTFRVNNPLKQRELALHLFCNLNISAERGKQIFFESAFLLPEEFNLLLERIKADYQQQEGFPIILEDEKLYSQFKNKLATWIELNNMPNLNDFFTAFQQFGFPENSFDHFMEDDSFFDYDTFDDDFVLQLLGKKRHLTKLQMRRLGDINRFILQNLSSKESEELASEE